jgi:hypothetical protein
MRVRIRPFLILGLVALLAVFLVMLGARVAGVTPFQAVTYLLRKWTDAIQAGAAVAVALFTYVLMRTSRSQLDVIAKQSDHMQGQLAAAKEAAAAATIQAQSARESIALAKSAFERTERPYVYILDVSPIEYGLEDYSGDYIPFLTYTVANYGKTPATILGVWHDSEEGSLPTTATMEAESDHPLLVAGFLGAGERREGLKYTFPFGMKWKEHDEPDSSYDQEHPSYMTPVLTDDLFFMVKISYNGPYSNDHFTCAGWRYDASLNKFVRAAGAEHNYLK